MPEDRPLTPATADDLEQALAHALQFDGRRQFNLAGESMAKITPRIWFGAWRSRGLW